MAAELRDLRAQLEQERQLRETLAQQLAQLANPAPSDQPSVRSFGSEETVTGERAGFTGLEFRAPTNPQGDAPHLAESWARKQSVRPLCHAQQDQDDPWPSQCLIAFVPQSDPLPLSAAFSAQLQSTPPPPASLCCFRF